MDCKNCKHSLSEDVLGELILHPKKIKIGRYKGQIFIYRHQNLLVCCTCGCEKPEPTISEKANHI